VALDGPEKLLAEESDLIAAAQAGDRPAFAVLVERYWTRLYRWLYHLTHDPHAAEDLAQETFLKAFSGLRTFRPDSNFRAWLFRIGHNNFVNQQRLRRGKRQPLPGELPTAEEGPVEQALSREALAHLTRAVGRLPTEFRSAFLLRAEEGLSFRQVAAVLGITEETARWRVFKARQKLVQALNPDLLPPSKTPYPPAVPGAD
jgi:RNA polymerase sigma-70 factor (ECF subfamily)